jgi:hypothetical protein
MRRVPVVPAGAIPEGMLLVIAALVVGFISGQRNARMQIAADEDFASSAGAAGIKYPQLIERLMRFGMNYNPERG